jgi:hypothetical protein
MGDLRAAGAGSCWPVGRSAWFAATVWPRPRPRLRAGFPGECVRRWGAARTKVRRITAAAARPGAAAAAAGRGRASLNSRLASNLQLAIIHIRSSAERAAPVRPCPARRPLTRVPAWAAGNWAAGNALCDAACAGFRRRPSAAVRRRRSGSIRAVSVVPRRRTAAHRYARIARLATAARCRRSCRRPAGCRRPAACRRG